MAITKTYGQNKDGDYAFKTDYGVDTCDGKTSGYVSKSPFRIKSGNFKISSDTIKGRDIKVLESNSYGRIFIPTSYLKQNPDERAYGEWEFYANKALGEFLIFIIIDSEVGASTVDGNNYNFIFRNNETIDFRKKTTVLIDGGTTTYDVDTWHKVKVTRNASNVFELFFNNVSIGTATDSSYTDSNYIIIEMGPGCKISYSDKAGQYSILKK